MLMFISIFADFTVSLIVSAFSRPSSSTHVVMSMLMLCCTGIGNHFGGKANPTSYLSQSPSRPAHLYMCIIRSIKKPII